MEHKEAQKGKVRFALVGCGAVMRKHITALSRIDSAVISAVCDSDRDAASKAGSMCNVPWFTDPGEMSKKVDFDIYSILTPSGNHITQVLDLVNYSRHFLVEKPLSLNVYDVDLMIDACEGAGVDLFVVKQNRFNRPIVKLKKMIDSGRFGKLVLGSVRVRWARDQSYYDSADWRGTFLNDGGVLANQAAHHLDMLLWLFGDVSSVMAMKSTQLVDIETEDTAAALLRFSNGAQGIIEATTATRPKDLEGSVSILGENGSVEIGGFFMNELKTWNFTEQSTEDEKVFEEWGCNPPAPAWNLTQYLEDVVHCLLNEKRPSVSGDSGRKSVELIEAINRSAESGREVILR